jgi:uncharacterized protein (TIGR02145 family)
MPRTRAEIEKEITMYKGDLASRTATLNGPTWANSQHDYRYQEMLQKRNEVVQTLAELERELQSAKARGELGRSPAEIEEEIAETQKNMNVYSSMARKHGENTPQGYMCVLAFQNFESKIGPLQQELSRAIEEERSNPEIVKQRQQEKIDKQYKELLDRKKAASSYETLTALSREFQAMNGYKDTSVLAEQCKSMAEDARRKTYKGLLYKKESASGEDDFENLYRSFYEMGNYENARALAAECNERYNKLKELREEQERKRRAEQELIERKERERREAEEQERKRIEDEKRKKRNIIIAILAILSIVLWIATNKDKAEEVANKPEKAVAPEIEKPEVSTFMDSRDKKMYKAITLGSQTWMAENLNYSGGGKCYNDDPANCQKYGRHFNWAEAKKACPAGWHLPSNEEWDALYKFADGNGYTESPYKSETAGRQLKAANGWNLLNGKPGNGEDAYGFAALPGGSYYFDVCDHVGNNGYWWSASEYDDDKAYYRFMLHESAVAGWNKNSKKLLLLNVRCVKNNANGITE